jgi:outer membrane murein-binding lipoprotein Lpp
MANTLTNFLIGIGFDTKDFDKGEKQVNSGLGSIKSRALMAGAALAGVGLALGAGAINAGNRIDKIALASAKLNTSALFVNNYGNALRMLGGDATESLQAIDAAERALADFRIKGKFGAFEDPTLAGIDTNALSQAKTGEDFLRQLSAQIPNLNKDQQRLIQESFGFSDATMASLRLGQKEFDAIIARAEKLAPGFEAAVEGARAFNKEMVGLQLRFEGVGNTLAAMSLDNLTGAIKAINGLIDSLGENYNKSTEKNPFSAVDESVNQYVFGKDASKAPSILFGGSYDQLAPALGMRQNRKPIKFSGNAKNSILFSGSAGDLGSVLGGGSSTQKYNVLDNSYVESLNSSVSDWRNDDREARYGLSNSRTINNPKQPPIQNNVNVKVELDGQAFDARVTQVQTRRDFNTIDDIRSTTAR